MSSMLGVQDNRRSRSKSPGGGRDRDRSHSRDTRSRDEPEREEYTSRRSSKLYAKEESASEDDRRYTDRRSSKKYYEEDEEKDTRRSKPSSKKYADESEEEDKYRAYKSNKDPRSRDISASDDDRGHRRSDKKSRSDSDSDRRKDRRERSSRKKYDESDEEAGSDARRRKRENTSNGTYGPPPGSYSDTRPGAARHNSYVPTDPRYAAPGAFPGDAPPAVQRQHSYSGASGPQYANPEQYRYANSNQIASQRKSEYERSRPSEHERSRPKDSRDSDSDHRRGKYEPRESKGSKYDDDRYETREPKSKKYYDDDEDDKYKKSSRKSENDKYGSSTHDVTKKMAGLAVGSAALGAATLGVARHDSHAGGKPPASPLLEAYRGTYQMISPMPSALVLANHKDDSDLSDLDIALDDDSDDPDASLKRKIRKLEREKEKYTKGPKGSLTITEKTEETRTRRLSNIDTNLNVEIREPGSSRRDRSPSVSILSPGGAHGNRERKSVSFYDPTEDAKKISAALSGTKTAPDPRPLVHILPRLSTDDLVALKAEYKNHAKVSGQGINMAKHIKLRVPGSLGKACYATALGRWESEAYWANSWYQGGASRRELLIESLMGRSNSDIREIKNCFKDKKYNDDLEKCIRT